VARHGPRVDALQIEAPAGRSIADVIQAKAGDLGADLIVAGAYGHARIRENLFGGVTRDLLERIEIPLLMSH
jgi:nucleotide-binding universal stress UspA family protein